MELQAYQALISRLGDVQCEKEMEALFYKFSEISQLEFFAFAVIRGVNSLSSPDVSTLSNYPKEWFRRYFAESMQKDDPVVKYCFGSVAPVCWNKLMQMEKYVSPKGEAIMRLAADVGLVNGVSIPINSSNGEIAIFSLATSSEHHVEDRLFQALSYAQVFGAHAIDSYRRIRDIHDDVLTPREQECLFWACEGKTTWEISKIIDVSERTVIFHLTGATQKMGAVNRQHAVAKALIGGLIRPTP